MRKASVFRPALLLLVIWMLLSYRLSTPLFGNQDAANIWIAASVRNFELYGLENTGLMVVRNLGPATPDQLDFYSHHPPFVTWLPALFRQVVGANELGYRFVFAAATLIGAAGLYSFVKRLYGQTVAFWSLAFYGLVPMVAYFGRVAGHDPLGIMAALVFGAVLVRWLDRPTRNRYIALLLLAVLAVWTAWPAVFFVALLGLGAMWLGDRRHRIGVLGIGAVTVVALIGMLIFYQLQWSESIQSLLDVFVWRTSNASLREGSRAFTLFEFVVVNSWHLLVNTTPAVVLLALLGAPLLRRYGNRSGNIMLLALLLGGLSYLLVFRNATFIHDYYKLVLIPAIAVFAAIAWTYLPRLLPGRRLIYRIALLVMVGWAVVDGSNQFMALHRAGMRPHWWEIIRLLKAHTTEQELIYSNTMATWDFVPAIEYYAFRNLVPRTSFESAQTQASEGGVAAHYLYCPTSTDPPDIPAPVYALRQSGGGCDLVPLDAG